MQTTQDPAKEFEDNRPISPLSQRQYVILRYLMASDYGGNAESIGDHVAYYLKRDVEHDLILRDLGFLSRNKYCLHRQYVKGFNESTYHILQKGGQHVLSYREPSAGKEYVLLAGDFGAPVPYIHILGITIYWSKYNLKRKRFSWWLDWHIARRWEE